MTPKQRYRASARGKATELAYRRKWEASDNGYFRRKVIRLRVLCKARGVICTMIIADLLSLWERQKGLCALTGRKMVLRERGPNSVSVDRKNPKRGYVRGNLRLVTWQANCARGEWTDKELIEFCRDVLRHHGKRKGARPPLKLVA